MMRKGKQGEVITETETEHDFAGEQSGRNEIMEREAAMSPDHRAQRARMWRAEECLQKIQAVAADPDANNVGGAIMAILMSYARA